MPYADPDVRAAYRRAYQQRKKAEGYFAAWREANRERIRRVETAYRRALGHKPTTHLCSVCRVAGHYKSTCPKAVTA